MYIYGNICLTDSDAQHQCFRGELMLHSQQLPCPLIKVLVDTWGRLVPVNDLLLYSCPASLCDHAHIFVSQGGPDHLYHPVFVSLDLMVMRSCQRGLSTCCRLVEPDGESLSSCVVPISYLRVCSLSEPVQGSLLCATPVSLCTSRT